MTSSVREHKNNGVGGESALGCSLLFHGKEKKFEEMVQQLPKPGAKDAPVLKAGHPPAGKPELLKAGGKRVVKKSLEDGATHGTPEKETKRSEKLRSLATSNRMQQVSLLLAGTLDKLSHDFPETPVSVRHSRLHPAVEKPHLPRTFFIQQPRKY